METIYAILSGIVFGFLASYSGMNKYDTITGLSLLKDFTIAKIFLIVIGIGGILLTLEIKEGYAYFFANPLYLIGTGIGGIIFGIGVSILGYGPSTAPISLGQGSLDAAFGIIGGLAGGVLHTEISPFLPQVLSKNIGVTTLYTIMGESLSISYIALAILISVIFISGAFILHKFDIKKGNTSRRWIITGIGIAILNAILFFKGWQRPLSASAFYPYAGDYIAGITDNSYYLSLITPGIKQGLFLAGVFIAGIIYSISTKTFRLQLIHKRWAKYRGTSKIKRIIWAFIGGVILILGARTAGGCSCGLIISGGMQFAVSAYIFAIFTFVSLIITSNLFYTRNKK